ncbi:sulfurtransferase complex subunit TusC [Shewanella sp. FJAT-52076]|uniref:sulfurtransferase complex subunit TusC n=1 Tax=Shewanella sp. FJAT-52076 TaxID=2864202 RepID=UPI001C655C35|nr:sulfurtransferase complex subunit TusC [Shewanella sp. FJAT-52076]QYJ77094.1 sulfurtransferase complex subunit TusC [Shewanella sp. FJAT-52076]
MKKLCVVFSTSPHGNAAGREALDFAMLAASYDLETSILFTDEGVLHLMANQNPESIGCRDYIATFGALEFYDIENLYVCKDSLKEFGIESDSLPLDVQVLTSEAIREHFASVNEVVVY